MGARKRVEFSGVPKEMGDWNREKFVHWQYVIAFTNTR